MELETLRPTVQPFCTWGEFVDMSPGAQVNSAMSIAHDLVLIYGPSHKDPNVDGGRCVYRDDHGPSCIIGHILNAIGRPDFNRIGYIWEDGGVPEMSWQALTVLTAMQSAQDNGLTWARAVDLAENVRDALESRNKVTYSVPTSEVG